MLRIFDWLRGRSPDGKVASNLYGSIVTQGRLPVFYTDFGVADVAEKRYELIVLHIVLVLERLRQPADGATNGAGDRGMVIAQALIETFVRDLDGSMREMAVGDTKVPAKVKKAAGGLLDRDRLYRQAFDETSDADDAMTVHNLVDELMFDGAGGTRASLVARYVAEAREVLGGWRLEDGVQNLAFPRPGALSEVVR